MSWEDPLRKRWQPTPVFLPGKSHDQRSLAATVCGITKESDTAEWLNKKVALQSCASVYCRAKCISYMCTHIPFLLDFLPIQVTTKNGVAFPVLYSTCLLYTQESVHVHLNLPVLPISPFYPLWYPRLFSASVSISGLQISWSITFS